MFRLFYFGDLKDDTPLNGLYTLQPVSERYILIHGTEVVYPVSLSTPDNILCARR